MKTKLIKCDFCRKRAVWFCSPLLNPDEPKLCDKHYKKIIQNQILLKRIRL
jgi:hypothetical protein